MTDLGFTRNDIVDLSREIWRGFLGLDIEPLDESIEVEVPEPVVRVCVTLRCAWYGALIVTYPVPLVEAAIAHVLGGDPTDLGDIRDVMGEIGGMFGGRLKYFTKPGTEVSLPIVATGDAFTLALPASHIVLSQSFVAADLPFRIDLFQAED